MKVQDMQWKDMEGMVSRRLSKLAMCKRGSIHTDINAMVKKLGKRPRFTKAELETHRKNTVSAIKKAWTPTVSECKRLGHYDLSNLLSRRASKVEEKYKTHPEAHKYDLAIARFKKQEEERIAQLDGDFMDVSDSFKLGITPITEFPAKFDELEAMEW